MSGIRFGVNSIIQRTLLSKYFGWSKLKESKTMCGANFSSISLDKDRILKNEEQSIHSLSDGNTKQKRSLPEGPNLTDFLMANMTDLPEQKIEEHPYVKDSCGSLPQKVYFDVNGCQMNVNDTEIIWSILKSAGYLRTTDIDDANIILVVTCAIRESAEEKIWTKLSHLKKINQTRKWLGTKKPIKVGLLGCMAERLKNKVHEKAKNVDVIAGPDSYRDLPRLLSITENREAAINVALSFDETYADVTPVRLNPDSVSAFVSIMRGCDNMCTYCIVPFVRGRERSRPVSSILEEVRHLSDQGIKEITLLGQNVNSYRDLSETKFFAETKNETNLAKGFKTVYKKKLGGLRFSDLLDKVSLINPEIRIRFTSPHPKDFPDEVLSLIASRSNICKQIHLPAQSGNSNVLERMRRGYTREAYLELVEHIRNIIPDIKLSSDFIAGFCGETDDEFEDTISLMEAVQYHMAYLFKYSMREKTTAHRRYVDDIPTEVKLQRVQRMTDLFRSQAERLNSLEVGSQQLVLIEGVSRRSKSVLQGRTDGNIRVLIPNPETSTNISNKILNKINPGDYVVTQICESNSHSLTGIPLHHSSIVEFSNVHLNSKV
ncbi:mitochondrial tRNA methylthiotransferase CDK5RAP1 [Chelonus insularis]|uniref:mitochondrial tRNA methylthiotransferase CDK5RAP1 n=1 Tax=Chelonus insularis TaxID=460826 RepID=UPI0015895AF6|nr:mitochondrial tRNA methylthiotransferase CDK5RAP1 [Chelonus insularis]